MNNLHSNSFELASPEASLSLASKLGARLKGGEVVELVSDLGGGKTTITKAIVSGAGSKDLVSSPSFTICNQYQAGKLTIYHFDFYRLNDPGLLKQQLEEAVNDDQAVVIIEWPAVIKDVLPERRLTIEINVTGDQSRLLKLSYSDQLAYLVEGL